MAAAPSSKSLYTYLLILLMIVILSIDSSTATRPGTSMMVITENYEKASLNSDQIKLHRRKHGSRYKILFFNLLPKGTLVPPSGPSGRHNSMVNSTPDQN
ncbi:Protein IDA-LIKE [Quillaja saponaria]|uniref:Protein IDA-LIKE n=1 Tax=Quillaja saponaria TaxID=32244 RepID=A0AAD7L9E6_QUISA|nr:Protein IDA-LIKE [Quillaja saponaria]